MKLIISVAVIAAVYILGVDEANASTLVHQTMDAAVTIGIRG